jgi:hypothetical protein
MTSFLMRWAAMSAMLAIWFAFKSIRRMVRIARRQTSGADLDISLREREASRGLWLNRIYGDRFVLALSGRQIHPASQFALRWLVHFPLAWVANLVSPLTWAFAFPAGIVSWLFDRMHFPDS